jgi:hypothetical protein
MENNSDEIYKELLIGIRVKLRSQGVFLEAIKTIFKILDNICSDPTNIKFHKFKTQN